MTPLSQRHHRIALLAASLIACAVATIYENAETDVTVVQSPDRARAQRFGYAVAISGDTLLVGTPGDDKVVENGGTAYIMVWDSSTWVGQQELVIPSVTENLEAGSEVALDGDTAVIGVPNYNPGGCLYVYYRTGTTWTMQAQLFSDDIADGDSFGQEIAIEGDTIVVGVPLHNNRTGAAYVFVRSGSTWTQEAKLAPADPRVGDEFGCSVDLDEDAVAVGAKERTPYEQPWYRSAGAIFIFTRSGTTWSAGVEVLMDPPIVYEQLGFDVSLDGDLLLAGSLPHYTGAAYVFSRDPTTDVWSQEVKLELENATDRDFFGRSVALDGNVALIGASLDSSLDEENGAAYTYWRHMHGEWRQMQKVWTPRSSGYTSIRKDKVGENLAIENGLCVVGSDGNGQTHGAVLVFNAETRETWTSTLTTSTTISTATTFTTTTLTTTTLTTTTLTTTTTISTTTTLTTTTLTTTTSTTTTTTTVTSTTRTSTTETTTTTVSSTTITSSTSSSTSSVSTTTRTSTSSVTTTTVSSTTSTSSSTVSSSTTSTTTSETSSTTTSSTTTSTVSTTTATTTTVTTTSRSSSSTATTITMTSTSTDTISTTTNTTTTTSSSSTSTSTTSTVSTTTVSSTSTFTTITETTTSTLSTTTTSSTTTSSTTTRTTTTVTTSSTASTTTETSTSTVTATSETSSTTSSTATTSTSSTTTVTTTTETTTSQTSTLTSTVTATTTTSTTSTGTTTTGTTTTETATTTTVTGVRATTMHELQVQIDEVEQVTLQDLIASGEDRIEARGVINAGTTVAAKATLSKMYFEIPYEEDITVEVTVPRLAIQDTGAAFVVICVIPERVTIAISDKRAPLLGDMLSVTFYDGDAVKLDARNLRKAVVMKLPSTDLNVSACGWYENATDSWSNYRLRTLDAEDDGYLRCATYHLTLFANVAVPEWRVVETVNEGPAEWLYPASLFFGFLVALHILLVINRRSRHQGEWQIEYIENAATAAIEKQAWCEDVKRLSRTESFHGSFEDRIVRSSACLVMSQHCRVCDADCARFLEAHKNRDPLPLGLPAKLHHPAFNPFWNSRLHKRTWILFLAFQPFCKIRRLTTKGTFWVCADFLAVPFVSFATTSALVAGLLLGFFGTLESDADPDPAVLGISVFLGIISLVLAEGLVRLAKAATAPRADSRLMRACVLFCLLSCLASTCLMLYNMSARAGLYWLAAAFTVFVCSNAAVPVLRALYYAYHAGRAYRAAPELVLSTYRNMYALKAESGEPPVHVWDCSHHMDGGKLKEQECIKDFSPIFAAWGLGARLDSDRPVTPDDDEQGDFTPIMCTNPEKAQKIMSLKSVSDGGVLPLSEPFWMPTQPVHESQSRKSLRQSFAGKTPRGNNEGSQSITEWNVARSHEGSTPLGVGQVALDWTPRAGIESDGLHQGREGAATAAANGFGSSRHAPLAGNSLGQTAGVPTAVGSTPRGGAADLTGEFLSTPHGAATLRRASRGSLPVTPLADPDALARRDSASSLDTEVLGSDRSTPAAAAAKEPGKEPDDDKGDDDVNFDPGDMVRKEHALSEPSRSGSPASSRGSGFSLPDLEDDDDADPQGKHPKPAPAGLWEEYAHHL